MKELRVRLLGSFEIATVGLEHFSLRGGKRAHELLAYLLLMHGQAKSRESLAEALWPEMALETGKKQIRQLLWNIHKSIDQGTEPEQRLISADSEQVAVNPCWSVWCDANEFAANALSVTLDTVASEEMESILALYRGPLLDGCYAEWCLIERERLEGLYLSTLDIASTQALARRDHLAAARWALGVLRLDPAHERSHYRLMRVYHAMDDRTRALRQFESCCRSLESELGVAPSGRTVALASAIRNDVEPTDQPTILPIPFPEGGAVLRELAFIRQEIDSLRKSLLDRQA